MARCVLLILLIAIACKDKRKQQAAISIPTSAEFQKAEALFYSTSQRDSAFYYFMSVTESTGDSLLVAMAYTYMAMIQEDIGDLFGCQESALEALRHVKETNPQHHYCLSSIYNELGASSAGLKNFDAALEYYQLAEKFQADTTYKAIAINNIAVTYRDKGDYKAAIYLFEEILQKQKYNRVEYARILDNLSNTRWLNDPLFNPAPGLRMALAIRMQEKDNIGITASYNHLSDFYLNQNGDSALLYAHKMYDLAQKINSADKKLDALRKLIVLAPTSKSKNYFRKYQTMSDSIFIARNRAKNQFALIRYRSEKTKAENLFLLHDNDQKKLQIFRQLTFTIATVVVAVALILFLYLRQRKRRRRLQRESAAAIHANQLRLSERVHDTVANRLYRLMSRIEHTDTFDKDLLLDEIEELYEQSRDISYEPTEYRKEIEDRIYQLVAAFSSSHRSINLKGNCKSTWSNVSPRIAKEIEKVLEELLINMDKHSEAKNIDIALQPIAYGLKVFYIDDGKGFPVDFAYGNGLTSTGNRIKNIGGSINFTKASNGGASIEIFVPTSKI